MDTFRRGSTRSIDNKDASWRRLAFHLSQQLGMTPRRSDTLLHDHMRKTRLEGPHASATANIVLWRGIQFRMDFSR